MKLAAIDIGSNAIRFQITHVLAYQGQHYFKKLEYVRFPLRLGADVFEHQEIKEQNRSKFLKLMHAFKLLIDLYEVKDYYACATSAMRESKNGREIVKTVKDLYDLDIHIIDGIKEAELINTALLKSLTRGAYLHIDVGGGSTELNFIVKGQKIHSKSFKLGSVRSLNDPNKAQNLQKMTNWIRKHKPARFKITAVGTGGNINKLFEISNTKSLILTLEKLKHTVAYLKGLSKDELIYKEHLNEDRADVVIPASEIYIAAIEAANATKIKVPKVGLKDGIMQMLYDKHLDQMAIN